MSCKSIINEILDLPYKVDLVYAYNSVHYVVIYFKGGRILASLLNYDNDISLIKENLENIIKNRKQYAASKISNILHNPISVTPVL